MGSIHRVIVKQKPIYLVQSYYKGDNCHGAYYLRAVEVGSKQLMRSYIFFGKNKTTHDITVEYDCHRDTDRVNTPDYFRITPKSVDVLLLNEQGVPQNKYLRYNLEQNGYRYTGVVK